MSKEYLPKQEFPAVPVANRVLWVNKEVFLPFNLEVGKSCPLGVFLSNPGGADHPGSMSIEMDNIHHRSGLLGKVSIEDAQGNIYRDSDLKGLGYVSNPQRREELKVFRPRKRGENDTWGIWRQVKAERERDITEDLIINLGVRTARMAAIILLEEIALPDGRIISIESAKEKEMLHANESPVLGLRLFRARERIRHSPQESLTNLREAKKAIGQELARELSWEDYLRWFALTLGDNLGKINQSYWHGYPSPQNITLACEIVDFGFGEGKKNLKSLSPGEIRQKTHLDFVHASFSLARLLTRTAKLGLTGGEDKLFLETFRLYEAAYKETRSPKT